ncbi:MAG: RHS repeat-associated protein [Arenicella sp.]|jgi:RHS repeat-associated protein
MTSKFSNRSLLDVLRFTLVGAAALVSLDVSAAGEIVGSDGGSVSVGNSGQATWSMPIEVPSGINGVAPNLTLSLSSSGGNGSLGVGGGLSGLSSITRCGRTVHQDGYAQAPQFLKTDAFCLDGARLVQQNSGSVDYGASGSVYRTEIETFQRIKAIGDHNGTGPASFEVTNRAGAKLIYGASSGTTDVDPLTGVIGAWKIDALIDSNTNTLHYVYEDVGSNEVLLTKISYGGHTSSPIVAEHLSVVLVYEDRPDTSTTWSHGQEYHQSKRISMIQTFVGNTKAKEYRLSYRQGAVTQASKLDSVQACAGNGDCYRKTNFTYSPETNSTWSPSSIELATDAAVQDSTGRPYGAMVDINNDGKLDWVTAYETASASSPIATYLGSGDGFQETPSYSLPDVLFDYGVGENGLAKGLLLDINADGWPDYVMAYSINGVATLETYRNTGSDFILDDNLKLPFALSNVEANGKVTSVAELADFNADGLVDLVQSAVLPDGQTVHATWIHRIENSGNHIWEINEGFKVPTISVDYTAGNEGRVFAGLQDINSDGLSDWVESYKLNGVTSNRTWLNTGLGWAASAQFKLPDAISIYNYDLSFDGVNEYIATDLNGDGLVDFSKSIEINGSNQSDSWINRGNAWVRDLGYNLPASMLVLNANGNVATQGGLIDLNSDGQPDFVLSSSAATIQKSGYWLFDKTTKQWNLTNDVRYAFPFHNNIIAEDGSSHSIAEIADLNHDGKPELFNAQTGAVYEMATDVSNPYPGVWIETQNPLGGVTKLTYGSSTDESLYEPSGQSDYPNVAYNLPVRLVQEIAVSNGVGELISAIHKYGKAKTNVLGQGGLGYQYHTMIDGDSGVQIESVFHQTYPYAGRIKASKKMLDDGGVLTILSDSMSRIREETISIHGLTTVYPHPYYSEAFTYDLSGDLLSYSESSAEIDGYGNTDLSVDKLFDSDGALVRTNTTTVTYDNDDSETWIFGLPIRTEQTVDTVGSLRKFTSVSTAEFHPDGKPKIETLEPGNEKAVTKTYAYDRFGNRETSLISAQGVTDRTSITRFTADGRFPRELENTLGHQVTPTFDPVIGKPLLVTDPNSLSKEFLYDGFGTVIRESKFHQSNGAKRGRQIVLPRWCEGNDVADCPANAVYFITALDDEGEAPEIGFYDVNGKELRKQTYGFHSKEDIESNIAKLIVVDTVYDGNGKVLSVTQPYFKDIETPLYTRYEYDVLGRQKKRINAQNNAFYTDYDGLTITTRNPGNNTSGLLSATVKHNILGQVIESVDFDQNSTKYNYDGRGLLVKTTDAAGVANEATIEYDDTFARKIKMNDPDLGTWSYDYDALGNLVLQTDAKGQVTTMAYDDLNRLRVRIDDATGNFPETTTWHYGTQNEGGDLIGGLKKVETTSPAQTTSLFSRTIKYDKFGRIVEASSDIGDQRFVQKTGYNGTAGKVDWISYPATPGTTGLTVRNTYDEYGYPNTVEKITLNSGKYDEFLAASVDLNKSQRDLERWKDDHLTLSQVNQLEEHERQIRLLGKELSEFYDDFNDSPHKEAFQDNAQRYINLVDQVQAKLTEHNDWRDTYQAEFDSYYNDALKADLDRIDVLRDQHADTLTLHTGYLAKTTDFARVLSLHGQVINDNIAIIDSIRPHADANLAAVHHHMRVLFKPHIADIYLANNFAAFIADHETEAKQSYVAQNYLNDISEYVITVSYTELGNHLTDFSNRNQNMSDAADRIAAQEKIIADNQYQFWFDYWNNRRLAEEGKLNSYGTEINTISTRIKPSTDRISLWLSPIIESHSNVILSYNSRARQYVESIAGFTGSYAKRDDLKSDKFLKPFEHHLNYLDCLGTKASGVCYADNLVHVFDDDGNVDEAKQAEDRGKVEDDTFLNIKQLLDTQNFFCPSYLGYSCPDFFSLEFGTLADVLHSKQCTLMSARQKEDSALPCDESILKIKRLPGEPVIISLNSADFYNQLLQKHQQNVETLVYNATKDTYGQESDYDDIVNNVVWTPTSENETAESREQAQLRDKAQSREQQCTSWTPTSSGQQPTCTAWINKEPDNDEETSDPTDFILIFKGDIQSLIYSSMSVAQREANRTLKSKQLAIKALIDGAVQGDYALMYASVQEKAAEVARLYNEIDQAYANAEYLDDYEASKKTYWQANDINSKGQIKKATYGNQVSTTWGYDQFGRINSVFTKKDGAGTALVSKTFEFDDIGNLIKRRDLLESVVEDFAYDTMNRLTQVEYSGAGAAYVTQISQNVVNYRYNEIGNLIHKSDILADASQEYTYGVPVTGQHAGPHAVTYIPGKGNYGYDANGNQISGDGRTINYSAFNKPTQIVKGGKTTNLRYGPERQMIKQQEDTDNGQEVTVFVGGLFEQIRKPNGDTVNRHHIAVAGNVIAIVETASDPQTVLKESYLHKNHQSSVVAISDASGNLAERRFFDAFGDIKNYIGISGAAAMGSIGYSAITPLSFTGHRFLVSANLVHMRGRVYDPTIGRFLSADPHIQSPLNSQSLNRYAYVLNNPLSFTDPSGYFFSSLFKALKKLFKKIAGIIKAVLNVVKKAVNAFHRAVKKTFRYIKKYARVIVAVVVAVAITYFTLGAGGSLAGTFLNHVIVGAAAGGASGLIMTGSLKGALEGAVFGAITAGFAHSVKTGLKAGEGIFSGLNKAADIAGKGINFAHRITQVVGHGIIGGLRSLRAGGKFLAGFVTAAVAKLVSFGTARIAALSKNPFVQGLVVATAGGLTSVLAGGSFELGFITAGLAFATNQLLSLSAPVKDKAVAWNQARRATRDHNKLGDSGLHSGTNIWKNNTTGEYVYSAPLNGSAYAYQRAGSSLAFEGTGQHVGTYDNRDLPAHTLVGIHIQQGGPFRDSLIYTRGTFSKLVSVFDVDITISTSYYGTPITYYNPAGPNGWEPFDGHDFVPGGN